MKYDMYTTNLHGKCMIRAFHLLTTRDAEARIATRVVHADAMKTRSEPARIEHHLASTPSSVRRAQTHSRESRNSQYSI